MGTPIESVLCTAATPAQAKLMVARLQAEGIPARTDGDLLADEFAASRRMLNLLGTKVFVPTASLERAREVVQPIAVDPDELERQALAATPEEVPPPERHGERSGGPERRTALMPLLLLLALAAAAVFALLWQRAEEELAWWEKPNPTFEYVPEGTTLREVRRSDGRLLRLLHHSQASGVCERIDTLDAAGRVIATADELVDGFYTRLTETREDHTVVWVDADRNGLFDRAEVTDRTGKVVQTIEWDPQRGFVVTPR